MDRSKSKPWEKRISFINWLNVKLIISFVPSIYFNPIINVALHKISTKIKNKRWNANYKIIKKKKLQVNKLFLIVKMLFSKKVLLSCRFLDHPVEYPPAIQWALFTIKSINVNIVVLHVKFNVLELSGDFQPFPRFLIKNQMIYFPEMHKSIIF